MTAAAYLTALAVTCCSSVRPYCVSGLKAAKDAFAAAGIDLKQPGDSLSFDKPVTKGSSSPFTLSCERKVEAVGDPENPNGQILAASPGGRHLVFFSALQGLQYGQDYFSKVYLMGDYLWPKSSP